MQDANEEKQGALLPFLVCKVYVSHMDLKYQALELEWLQTEPVASLAMEVSKEGETLLNIKTLLSSSFLWNMDYDCGWGITGMEKDKI